MLEILAALVKALGYAAALSGAGITLADATLARGLASPARLLTVLLRWSGVALALAACCSTLLFLLRLGGEIDRATIEAVFLSPLGAALALQLAGGLWLALAAGRLSPLPGAALILAAFGIIGHSATRGILTSATVILHVAAAAWWLGGLWLLLASRHSPAFSLLVNRFSRQAVWVVAVLLVAAMSTAALLLEFRFDPALAYQRGLMAKFALTLVLLALAGVNRLALAPRLAAEPKSHAWLRRTIVAELLLFAGIIATTAWLTTYQSPHNAPHPGHVETLQVDGPIGIIDPWAPAMPGGIGTGAGYMVIVNNQPEGDRLIAAKSPWAEHVTLHASTMDGNIARMRNLKALEIPPGQRVTLEPGVYHLMFERMHAPFVAGDQVPLTLVFERGGEVEVTLAVQPLGSRPDQDHEHAF